MSSQDEKVSGKWVISLADDSNVPRRFDRGFRLEIDERGQFNLQGSVLFIDPEADKSIAGRFEDPDQEHSLSASLVVRGATRFLMGVVFSRKKGGKEDEDATSIFIADDEDRDDSYDA